MSVVTNFLMYTAIDEAAMPTFLADVGMADGGVAAERVPHENFAGTKAFEGDVYAAAGNYWDISGLQELLNTTKWEVPEQVVVICCTEDSSARVFRPGGSSSSH